MAVIPQKPFPPQSLLREYVRYGLLVGGIVAALAGAILLQSSESPSRPFALGYWLRFSLALVIVTGLAWIGSAAQAAARRAHRRRFPEPLDSATLERLEAIGEVTDRHRQYWKEIWWRDGPALVESLLKRREDATARSRELLPRLIAFAAECRQRVPAPDIRDFTLEDQHEYEILRMKMQDSRNRAGAICEDRPDQVQIHVTTRVGLAVVPSVFPSERVVVLLPEERDRWLSQFEEEAIWEWNCVIAWWLLRRELSDVYQEYIEAQKLPAGTTLWGVETGTQWGSMHGGALHEIWLWDGQNVSFGTITLDETF